jgi:tripeptidyl-peptidase I
MRTTYVTLTVVTLLCVTLAVSASPTAPRVLMERHVEDFPLDMSARDAWTMRARASPDTPMKLHFFVKQQNMDTLEKILFDVSDPSSENYGKHLSFDAVNQLSAPKVESVIQVISYLQQHGVDITTQVTMTPNADIMQVSVDVATAEKLLEAQYNVYEHHMTGQQIHRIADTYTLPAHVAAHVDFVGPTIRFPLTPSLRVHSSDSMLTSTSTSSSTSTDEDNASSTVVTPDFLRKLYNIGDAVGQVSSNHQAVVAFLDQFISLNDLSLFNAKFATDNIGMVPVMIGPNNQSNPGVEASLDIQYIAGVAQKVNSTFWSTAGSQPGNPENEPFLNWLFDLAYTANVPQVFSISYADMESGVVLDYAQRVNNEFIKAGARGISLLAGSGDGGVSGPQSRLCTVFAANFPTASPYILSIGGTTGSNPEVAAQFSSGGFSNRWARPYYQKPFVKHYFSVAENVPPSQFFNQTGIGFPDVAAQAENYQVIVDGKVINVDGTSCATPTFSALIALLNDQRLQAGKSVLGFLPPLMYANPQAFNDIVSGNNPGCGRAGGSEGFYCAAGWDPVTGLGTLDFAKLSDVVASLP